MDDVEKRNEHNKTEEPSTSDDRPEKISLLLKALDHTQTNYRHTAQQAQSLFSWIGSVLLATVGALAAIGPAKLAAFGLYLRVGLTVAVGTLFIFAWVSEIGYFKARVEEGKSAVKIGRLLHFFEAGYFDKDTVIFDKSDWSDWMTSWRRRLGISPHTSVLFVLTCVVIVVIWAS